MYHRYMPTGNGQFRRQTIPSPQEQKNEPPMGSRQQVTGPKPPTLEKNESSHKMETSGNEGPRPVLPFLSRLFPGMDSGDMLVVLILLLLLLEGNEESASVVMTLAIFLFLQ